MKLKEGPGGRSEKMEVKGHERDSAAWSRSHIGMFHSALDLASLDSIRDGLKGSTENNTRVWSEMYRDTVDAGLELR
jgi:hypothetical protein